MPYNLRFLESLPWILLESESKVLKLDSILLDSESIGVRFYKARF